MNQLALIESMTPAQIYESGKIDDILTKIKEEARSEKLDISTPQGRKEIASLAHKVARSKTFLDGLGQKLGEEHREALNRINAERKKVKDDLDALKEEIRKPLTEWENKETERVAAHEGAIKKLIDHGNQVAMDWNITSVAQLKLTVESLEKYSRDWEEFVVRGQEALGYALGKSLSALAQKQKYEFEQAELKKLQEEAYARQKKEHEERIAREAAEKAKFEAERKAEQERKAAELKATLERQKMEAEQRRIENERIQAEEREKAAIQAKINAEKRAKEMEEKAAQEKKLADEREAYRQKEHERLLQIEKEEAIAREQKRVADLKAKEEAEAKAREENKKHQAKVHKEIIKALSFLTEEQAKQVIVAIAKNQVPNVKINY